MSDLQYSLYLLSAVLFGIGTEVGVMGVILVFEEDHGVGREVRIIESVCGYISSIEVCWDGGGNKTGQTEQERIT